jgi:hypothetical protein
MKIYNMIKIKMATGKTIAEESFEYDGPLTLAVDGPSGSDGSGGGDTGETDNSEKSNESDNVNSEDQTNFENTYNGNYDNGNYDCGTVKTPEGKEIPCICISKKTVETDSYEYGNNSGYDIGSRSGGDGGSGTSLNAPGRQTEFKDLFSSYLQNSSTAQFTTGLFTGGITAIAPGGFLVNPFVDSLNYPRSFKMGYGLGQATWGTLEMLGGFGGHLLGFAFDTTGFGALAGIPTHVLSNAVGIEGAADFVAGYGVFRSAVSNKNAGGSSETSGPKTTAGPYIPEGPMVGKRIGHTFNKHGSHNTEQLLKQAKGSGMPQGQWIDDVAAEKFIAERLDQIKNGAKTFELPPGMGRVVNPDGTFTQATHARLVPSNTGVKTAFPMIE